jgi:hypothetical protein
VSQTGVAPIVWASAFGHGNDLIDDRRPRVKVWQVFVDGSPADPALVFLREDSGAELASAVPVGVARVAHGLIR